MHHDFIDRYSRKQSRVHHAPAGVKLAIALALVAAIVIVPAASTAFFAGAALLLVVLAVASTVPIGFLFGRLLILEPFVAGVAILALFQPHGQSAALTIVIRSSLSLATLILLTNTTPFAQLLAVLKAAHVPALFVTVVALMYRYLFVLIDEAERMQRARESRTFRAGRVRAWWTSASLVGQLFVRSTARAERIYAAMCARGWQ